MSYDVLFVPAGLLGSADPLAELARAADEHPHAELTADQLTEWSTLAERLRPVLPTADRRAGPDGCLLADSDSGLRLTRDPAGLALSIPAWHTLDTGEAGADGHTHDVLQRVAAEVERVTGLVAYDLQTRAPFVGGTSGRRPVAETSDTGRLDAYVGGHESGHLADTPTLAERPADEEPGRWRRLFKRG